MTTADDLDPNAEVDPDDDAGEELEARIEQADHAFGAESFGTTAEEGRRGESLDQLLSEEQPDPSTTDVGLVLEELDEPDHEPELIAEGDTEREPYLAPEDAAMTVRDSAPGGVTTEGDPYVDGDEGPREFEA